MGEFIKSATKKSLLAFTKKGEITPRFWARFFEAFVTKDELQDYAADGSVDHGLLSGLTHDDHTQYYNSARHSALTHSFVEHGNLTGLADDDHAQYLLASSAGSRVLFASNWTDLTDSGATTLHKHDHGGMDGLADDDHSQYSLVDGTRAFTGTVTVGSTASNGILLDPVNGIYLYGSATAWDDLRVAADSTKLGGSKDPGYAVFKTDGGTPASQGVFTYWFDDSTEQEVYFSIQMPHRWLEGSDVHPHVHWVPAATAGGAGTDVCWGLEYTWANINATYGNTSIIYGDTQSNGAGETITASKHYLTPLTTISGTGKTLSSMLVCRLFRDATSSGGTDDYVGDAGLLEFDLHYQINALGSDDEYTKGP